MAWLISQAMEVVVHSPAMREQGKVTGEERKVDIARAGIQVGLLGRVRLVRRGL